MTEKFALFVYFDAIARALGQFLSLVVQKYFEKLCDLGNDLSFLPGKLKIEKVKERVDNLHDKTEYVVQIKKN